MTGHPNKLWTPEEDAVILANPGFTGRQLHALLPGRSSHSCTSRRLLLRFRREREALDAAVLAPMAHKVRHEDYASLSLTARLMGDPSPSRSALAQKQQGGMQHG